MAEIKDSGERTTYTTGAVRDCKEGKGRCDLMPLKVVATFMRDDFISHINEAKCFAEKGDNDCCYTELIQAMRSLACTMFDNHEYDESKKIAESMLEVAKHFEDGAKKYGENNWQKGIPLHSYIDSAVRHYLKLEAGWTDEHHDRAAMWNTMCAAWTVYNHPELNDFYKKSRNDALDALINAFSYLGNQPKEDR